MSVQLVPLKSLKRSFKAPFDLQTCLDKCLLKYKTANLSSCSVFASFWGGKWPQINGMECSFAYKSWNGDLHINLHCCTIGVGEYRVPLLHNLFFPLFPFCLNPSSTSTRIHPTFSLCLRSQAVFTLIRGSKK